MFKEFIDGLLESHTKSYKEHRQRIIDKANDLNSGWLSNRRLSDSLGIKTAEPTEGVDGRLHAPFDGFLWENPYTMEIEEYGGGQYLPVIGEWDDIEKPISITRNRFWKLRLTIDMYNVLAKTPWIEVGLPYKKWNIGDVPVCMAEVKTHRKFLVAIQEYSNKVFDDIYNDLKKDKGEAPDGKQVIKGTVLRVKIYEDFYGIVSKMTVELENKSTVYGSLPKCVPLDYRGEIEFKATFEQAKDDKTHAFFKRPSSVKIKSDIS